MQKKKTSFTLSEEALRHIERKMQALRKKLGYKVSKTSTVEMMAKAFQV